MIDLKREWSKLNGASRLLFLYAFRNLLEERERNMKIFNLNDLST
ncbi:hypothetical protein HNQ80_000266 [Anaerosolibacter carboniphilus]|uniref:Uncharacterized protein n=1 Tax=Anaerosolibacter carboniphilus TaxID=1417629 RepID=A0A841KL72_9FIRM|nr:hypothetical protein [Anaerosolibacter carboniphilus]